MKPSEELGFIIRRRHRLGRNAYNNGSDDFGLYQIDDHQDA